MVLLKISADTTNTMLMVVCLKILVILKSSGAPFPAKGLRKSWIEDYVAEQDKNAESNEILNPDVKSGGKDSKTKRCFC